MKNSSPKGNEIERKRNKWNPYPPSEKNKEKYYTSSNGDHFQAICLPNGMNPLKEGLCTPREIILC